MTGMEVLLHVRRKARQLADLRGYRGGLAWGDRLGPSGFPTLPAPENVPEALSAALARESEEIQAGRWLAFGYLPLQVDDPPLWHRDYLAGVTLASDAPGSRLDHRSLPGGADVKLIWELSRWAPLVRLAMAAYLLGDSGAARTCIRWLDDWVGANPPYRGWNWTTALEAGIRLIQYAWIEALLEAAMRRGVQPEAGPALASLRSRVLPPHARYVWRNRSFGSSANNHLLGELAGLTVAVARWPGLAEEAEPIGRLADRVEREVLLQFAGDGGNREQALNYHLFSMEFAMQGLSAMRACGLVPRAEVRSRFRRAGAFYVEVQVPGDRWDYGDGDDAFVTPWFVDEKRAAAEWHEWLSGRGAGSGLGYWLGAADVETLDGPPSGAERVGGEAVRPAEGWRVYGETGMAVVRAGRWFGRWDLSELGYLSTCAHGHLDCLHLSLWHGGRAVAIDPGTGAYYARREVRDWLASWEAHNGPHPVDGRWPARLGPFLWGERHARAVYRQESPGAMTGSLEFPSGRAGRTVEVDGDGVAVTDRFEGAAAAGDFAVCWHFAPGLRLTTAGHRRWRVEGSGFSGWVEIGPGWLGTVAGEGRGAEGAVPGAGPGIASPRFRQLVGTSYLRLTAPVGTAGCVTRFRFAEQG